MSILRCLRRANARRRVRSALLVAGFAMATLLATAGTASANPEAASAASTVTTDTTVTMASSACPSSGALCLYDGTDFTGELFTVTSLRPGGTCVSLVDHGWGDRARSAINTHNSSAAMFSNDNCASGPFQVPPSSSLPSFGTFTPKSVWVPYWLS